MACTTHTLPFRTVERAEDAALTRMCAWLCAQGGALQERWSQFVRLSVPFLTKVAALGIQGGAEALQVGCAPASSCGERRRAMTEW